MAGASGRLGGRSRSRMRSARRSAPPSTRSLSRPSAARCACTTPRAYVPRRVRAVVDFLMARMGPQKPTRPRRSPNPGRCAAAAVAPDVVIQRQRRVARSHVLRAGSLQIITAQASRHVVCALDNLLTGLNLETAVGRARVSCAAVGWQDATTLRAHAREEEQRGSIGCVALSPSR